MSTQSQRGAGLDQQVSDRDADAEVGRLPRRWLRYLLPLAAALTLLAGGGFAAIETDTVTSYWEGLWWALSLMTTVGFVHDIPKSVPGQALSALLMVLGFIVLAMTTAAVASLFVREDEAPTEVRETAFERAVLDELRVIRARLDTLEARLGGTDEVERSPSPTESSGAPDGQRISSAEPHLDASDSPLKVTASAARISLRKARDG